MGERPILQNDLAASTRDWIIAFGHHPPYLKGSYNSATETQRIEMRQNMLPIPEVGGGDLVLTGHSHSDERSYRIAGHYGLSRTFSPANVVEGGGGQDPTPHREWPRTRRPPAHDRVRFSPGEQTVALAAFVLPCGCQMAPPLVQLENVDVSLDGTTVLRHLRWRLLPGEHWAILGANGSGKSVLLRLIRGDLWPAPGRHGRRVYHLNGQEQETAVGIRERMPLVSPELQQRYLQTDLRLTAWQVVQSGFAGGDYLYQRPTGRQERRAQAVLRLLEIAALAIRPIQELSTGELRRILIARALVSAPPVLVCDEICDGLDAPGRAALLQSLDRVARRGTQLLYTTHRKDEWLPSLTHCLVLARGRITAQGPIASFSRHPWSASQRAARATPKVFSAPTIGTERMRAKPNSNVLIRIEGANVFLSGRQVLFDLHWELRAGQHWAVLGPNGAGKTTLLKLICGDLHAAAGGRVRRFGLTARDSIWAAKRRIGSVSPDLQASYRDNWTGEEVVASGFSSSVGLRQGLTRRQRARVGELLAWTGLEALSQRRIPTMSHGEFRRILLARALVRQPDILVFDEPFDGLDLAARTSMTRLLESIAARGTSLVVVSHHANELPTCMTHLAHLAGGQMVRQTLFRVKNRTSARAPSRFSAEVESGR